MKFERAHSTGSSYFFAASMEGRLGDDLDFVEWAALFQMRRRLLDKKAEFETI